MGSRTITDFVRGEMVYHKTNGGIKMVVIGTNEESNEVTCRWIDKTGKEEKRDFFIEELIMAKDRVYLTPTLVKRRRDDYLG